MDTSEAPQIVPHTYIQKKPVVGALLVHGLNGSRRDMAELEIALQERGWLTNNMLLPGHGAESA